MVIVWLMMVNNGLYMVVIWLMMVNNNLLGGFKLPTLVVNILLIMVNING